VPEPHNQLDDLDPKEYAFAVVNPYWMGGLEQRVRYALESTGFEITRMLTNPDESMVTFWLRLGQRVRFGSVTDAHAALRQNLIAAGCPCANDELVLWCLNGEWDGAYAPTPTADDVDPTDYLYALPPYV
jgi:hypothetical protein